MQVVGSLDRCAYPVLGPPRIEVTRPRADPVRKANEGLVAGPEVVCGAVGRHHPVQDVAVVRHDQAEVAEERRSGVVPCKTSTAAR